MRDRSVTFHYKEFEFELIGSERNGEDMQVFLYVGTFCKPDLIEIEVDKLSLSVWGMMQAAFYENFHGEPQEYDGDDAA